MKPRSFTQVFKEGKPCFFFRAPPKKGISCGEWHGFLAWIQEKTNENERMGCTRCHGQRILPCRAFISFFLCVIGFRSPSFHRGGGESSNKWRNLATFFTGRNRPFFFLRIFHWRVSSIPSSARLMYGPLVASCTC